MRTNRPRHLAALAAFTAVALAAAGTLDAVARHDAGPGTVWVVVRSAGMPQVLRHDGLRLVDAWAGGRLLQLHTESLRNARVPGAGAWLVWHVPPAVFTLPGCG